MGKNGLFNKWLGQMDSHIQNYELGLLPLGDSFLDIIPKAKIFFDILDFIKI